MANNCIHIYKIMGSATCPECGLPTHETDWSLIAKLHKKWVKENPNYEYQWWSI